MTPADIAAIEARWSESNLNALSAGMCPENAGCGVIQFCACSTIDELTADLAALLAHIRTKDAEREAEIAAAVAAERERIAQMVRQCGSIDAHAIAAAIREPKP